MFKIFKKLYLLESRFYKNRTIVYNLKLSKLHHRCYYQGDFKLLQWQVLKISRKILYVIEFTFTKIVRVYSTAYYDLKNPLQILFWRCRLFKRVLKILKNLREKLCYGVPLSKLQGFRLQLLALPSMFGKFWKIPDIMWSSFLQKQQFHPIKFFPLPMKVLVRPIVTWNGTQNELILKGTLRKLSACGAYCFENLQFKNFWSPPFNRISRGMSSNYLTSPNGKSWKV